MRQAREAVNRNELYSVEDAVKLVKDFAKVKFGEGFDYVVLGHIHEPDALTEIGHTYLNLGDWITHFTYGIYDGEELRLCYWKGTPKV